MEQIGENYTITIELLKQLCKLGFQLNPTGNPHSIDFNTDMEEDRCVVLWWFFEADNWVIVTGKGATIPYIKTADLLDRLPDVLAECEELNRRIKKDFVQFNGGIGKGAMKIANNLTKDKVYKVIYRDDRKFLIADDKRKKRYYKNSNRSFKIVSE